MRRGLLALLALTSLAVTGCFPRGSYPLRYAGNVPFRMVNQSPMTVYTVNISPSSSGYWGDDWLGSSTIPSGGVFDFGVLPGIYDIRANAPNGMVLAEARGIDLRGAQQLIVTPGGFAPGAPSPTYAPGAPGPYGGQAYVDPSQGGYVAQPTPPPGYGVSGAVQVNSADAPPPPPTPASGYSLTLHNDCPQTIGLFHGSGRPPSGSGTYTSIGSNTTESFSGLPGEQFWIIDANRNGLSAFTPSGTQSMNILNSCNGFVPQ